MWVCTSSTSSDFWEGDTLQKEKIQVSHWKVKLIWECYTRQNYRRYSSIICSYLQHMTDLQDTARSTKSLRQSYDKAYFSVCEQRESVAPTKFNVVKQLYTQHLSLRRLMWTGLSDVTLPSIMRATSLSFLSCSPKSCMCRFNRSLVAYGEKYIFLKDIFDIRYEYLWHLAAASWNFKIWRQKTLTSRLDSLIVRSGIPWVSNLDE